MIVAVMTTALAGTAWAADVTLASWTFTSESYPSNKTNFLATDGSCLESTFYLNGTGSTWNTNKGYAFTAVTDITITLKTTVALPAGTEISFSADTYYNKASNAPMTGFNLTASENGEAYSTTGLNIISLSLSNSSATKTCVYTLQSALAVGETVAIKYTQTGKAGAGQGYFGNIIITYTSGGTPTPTTYTVTYNANGATSGDVPTDNNSYSANASVTVLGNTGSLTKTDYTFAGWNTAADGSGTDYDADDTFTINANTILYAQWEEQSGDAQWVLTSLSDLTPSDVFVIVGNNGSNYAMSNGNGTSSAPAAVSVTIEGSQIKSTVASNIKWNISGNASDGYTFYPNGDAETWLYCTNTNNGVRVGTNDNKTFTVDKGYLKHAGTSRYVGVYNSQDWRCYTSTDGNIANQTFAFYKKVTGGVIPPSITASTNEIAYDATSGSITYSVVNPVEGGVVTASSSEGWLTVGTPSDGTIALTCAANSETTARTTTVTLTYTYNTNETVTTDVTVTQAAAPVIYTTIPALFEKATEVGSTATDVNVTFNNWVVSAISTNGKNVFVTDNAGNGFIIYDTNGGLNNTYSVGNILSGTAVACKVQKFNGSAEVTGLNASDLTITTGGSVTAANVAMADLAGVNTGALVSYENLTCSVSTTGIYTNYDMTDGTTTIRAYTTLYDFTSTPDLEDGKTYNIKGIFQQYNSTKEIMPRSAADIEEVTIPHTEYTLTVSNLSNVEMFVFDADDDTNPLLEGEGNAQILDGTEVLISVSAETGYVLESLVVDGNDVTNQIDESGAYTFTMPTHAVTVTATAVASNTNTYTLATTITSGKHYLIANTAGDKVMSTQNTNNRRAVNATPSSDGTTISVDLTKGAREVVIYGPDAENRYAIYDGSSNGGYLYAASSSSNYLRTQTTNNDNGLWEITFNTDGEAAIVAQGSNTNNTLRYNSNSTLFSCYSSGQGAIKLFVKAGEATPTETRTLNSEGYATYASQNALDFSDYATANYSAWQVTGVDNTTGAISFTQITGKVPAGTGMLLKGSGSVTLTSATNEGDVETLTSNKLEGIIYQKTITADQYYGLSGKTFVKVNGGKVPAGRALLPASVVDGEGTPVNAFTFNFDEDATAIKAIDNGQLTTDGVIYNVAGQRLSKMQKGINIVNGRKVLY